MTDAAAHAINHSQFCTEYPPVEMERQTFEPIETSFPPSPRQNGREYIKLKVISCSEQYSFITITVDEESSGPKHELCSAWLPNPPELGEDLCTNENLNFYQANLFLPAAEEEVPEYSQAEATGFPFAIADSVFEDVSEIIVVEGREIRLIGTSGEPFGPFQLNLTGSPNHPFLAFRIDGNINDGFKIQPTLEEVAEPSVNEGKYIQQLEEMRRLSKRNAWNGVEAAYQVILGLGEEATVSAEAHHLGSQAARVIGNITAQYERLRLMLASNPTKSQETQAIEALNDISSNFGLVVIAVPENSSYTLTPSFMPFAPFERDAIAYANKQLEETGSFKGLLPDLVRTVPGTAEPIHDSYSLAATGFRAKKKPSQDFQVNAMGPTGYDEQIYEIIDLIETTPEPSVQAEELEQTESATNQERNLTSYFGVQAGYVQSQLSNGNILEGPSFTALVGPYFDIPLYKTLSARLGGNFSVGGFRQKRQGTSAFAFSFDEGLFAHLCMNKEDTAVSLGPILGLQQIMAPASSAMRSGSEEVIMKNLNFPTSPWWGAQMLIDYGKWGMMISYKQNSERQITGELSDFNNAPSTTTETERSVLDIGVVRHFEF